MYRFALKKNDCTDIMDSLVDSHPRSKKSP